MAESSERKYLIPGLERGLALLMAISKQNREMTFAELHRLIDMPRATAYRVVQTLEHMGFLQRGNRTNVFTLGVNVLRLGLEHVASLDVVQIGQPVIEQLRDRSGYSSHLAIRDGRDVIYVARVSGAGAAINEVRVGTRLPVHRTSLGRMLISNLPRSDFEQLYPDPLLPEGSSHVFQDREALWQAIQEDRQRGYVMGESFYRYGISSVVFPVFNYQQKVEAVVSILVPTDQIPNEARVSLLAQVQEAAAEISNFLGAQSPR